MPRRLFLAVCAVALVPCLAACGDDADDGDALAAGPTGAATSSIPVVAASTASPNVTGPAGRFSVSIEDIGLNWRTDIPKTFEYNSAERIDQYAARSKAFPSPSQGRRMLRDWGYAEGYETGYLPEGLDDAVLQGSFYISIETHLFESEDGARKAYEYFTKTPLEAGALPLEIQGVGNQAAGFVTISGKIAGSSVNAVYHQVVFRRGNAVEVILTKGAQGFAKLEPAWELARIADAKLLGDRTAVQPTPTSNYKTPTPVTNP
jgi:hypothetical protein